VNGDGKPDLIIGTPTGINVLLNNGTGSFGAAVHTDNAVSSIGSFFTTGDFNNDGRLDVVLGDSQGNLQTLIGHGDGTFTALAEVSGDPILGPFLHYFQCVSADLNGDGKLDLVFAQAGNDFPVVISGGFNVLRGNGDGTFDSLAVASEIGTAFNLGGIAVADLNGDGKPDILTASNSATALTVSLNDGTGKFPTLVEYAVNRGPATITAGDFNGDGRMDIASGEAHGVSMLLNLGHGVLRAPLTLDGGQVPFAATTTDLNRDGITDIAEISLMQPFRVFFGQVYAFLGTRTGTFGSVSMQSAQMFNQVLAVADINDDGFPDICAWSPLGTLEVEFFTPATGLTIAPTQTPLPTNPTSMVAGDFNGDGKGDIAYVDGTGLEVLLGNGDGTFKTPVAYGVGTNPVFVSIRDVNHDGKSDLLVVNQGSNDVSVLLGTGTGTFGPAHNFAAGISPTVLTTGDFNRDGKVDLAVGNQTNVAILLGNGNGTFETFHNYPAGEGVGSISQASFEKLGFEDIVIGGGQSFFILPGNGDGTFQAPVLFSGGSVEPVEVLTGDFNGDGAPDLALWNQGSMGTVIFFNQSGVQVKLTSSLDPSHHGHAVTFTATVAPSFPGYALPTGTIAFKDGKTVLALAALSGGRATHSTSNLSVGTHSITATYYGSSQFHSAKSAVVAQKVIF
jgi:hypothetical protein